MTGGSGFIGKLFGGKSKEERMDEAKELFEKAANSYKLGDDFFNAGVCYDKCADIER